MSTRTRRLKWFALALAATESSPSSAARIPPCGRSSCALSLVQFRKQFLRSSRNSIARAALEPAPRIRPRVGLTYCYTKRWPQSSTEPGEDDLRSGTSRWDVNVTL